MIFYVDVKFRMRLLRLFVSGFARILFIFLMEKFENFLARRFIHTLEVLKDGVKCNIDARESMSCENYAKTARGGNI